MKKLLTLAVMALVGFGASAQLSTAETTANNIRVGNRPGQGSFGIYVGVTADMMKDAFDKNTKFQSLPLVNVKYMVTDNWEARVGLQFYKKSESATYSNDETEFKSQWSESKNRIYPGVAYHFARTNILDVYGGAELLFGWEHKKNQTLADDYIAGGMGSMSAFQFGGGLFIGLQAFIADLPLALGLEYGFNGYGNYGVKYKAETQDGDVYTVNPADFKNISVDGSWKDLSAKKSQFGQEVRITLSYYFNR